MDQLTFKENVDDYMNQLLDIKESTLAIEKLDKNYSFSTPKILSQFPDNVNKIKINYDTDKNNPEETPSLRLGDMVKINKIIKEVNKKLSYSIIDFESEYSKISKGFDQSLLKHLLDIEQTLGVGTPTSVSIVQEYFEQYCNKIHNFLNLIENKKEFFPIKNAIEVHIIGLFVDICSDDLTFENEDDFEDLEYVDINHFKTIRLNLELNTKNIILQFQSILDDFQDNIDTVKS